MKEPEVLFPVNCPICERRSLTRFRISVVADALRTGEIRLYADCHVTSWDASPSEILAIREYLDMEWGAHLQQACQEFFRVEGFLDRSGSVLALSM